MIVRHNLIEAERIEKPPLLLIEPPHHRSPPPMFASQRRNHRPPIAARDFCNKIGTSATLPAVRSWSASEWIADICKGAAHRAPSTWHGSRTPAASHITGCDCM